MAAAESAEVPLDPVFAAPAAPPLPRCLGTKGLITKYNLQYISFPTRTLFFEDTYLVVALQAALKHTFLFMSFSNSLN